MKRTDKETLEMLQREFQKSADNAKVPLRLQKESVVTMLKNSEETQKDFSVKTGNKGKIIAIRRFSAVAAAFAVVIAVILFTNQGGVRVIKTDTFNEGYESVEPVKGAKSIEDIERVVREIFGVNTDNGKNNQSTGDKKNPSTTATSSKNDDGYPDYIAQSKLPADNNEYTQEILEESEGIVTNGDFKADILKTDGKYLYIVATGTDEKTGRTLEQIKIISAEQPADMQVVSTVILSDGQSASTVDECFEIYLKNNTLIALINRYSFSMNGNAGYDSVSTAAVYYDISDPANPVKLREHIQDGKYVSSSLYENTLSLVTQKSIVAAELSSQASAIPSFTVNGEKKVPAVEEIFIAVNDPEASFLFITVTDINNPDAAVGKLAVLGCGKEIYCSAHTVAVSRGFVSVEADSDGEYKSLTEIYRFDINGTKITFAGSYIAEGKLVGGISVDESNGTLRAATSNADSSNLYVLNEKMEFVSGLKEIFPGEKVKGVKFIGDNAYFVAGDDSEKTLIVNLSEPSKPSVAGNISTEGFYRELYEVSQTALLTIRRENEKVVIALIDTSDPSNPVTGSSYTLEGDMNLLSLEDSRSIMLDSEKKLFGIPVVNENPATGAEISSYILFSVADGTISPVGTYNHSTDYTGDAAVRGVCINDAFYTVSGERITAFSIEDYTVTGSLNIR